MSIEAMFSLEIEGITKTINDYAVENFITSYSTQLYGLQLPKDKDMILIIIVRLIEWYQSNIDNILLSKFVRNKEEHVKTMKLLLEFRDMLN